jgi:hypothetical protein
MNIPASPDCCRPGDPAALACNLGAISATDRPRYGELTQKLALGIRSRHELADGFTFGLAEECLSLAEIAEWIGLERKCCPFLTFRLEVAAASGALDLTLRGPAGTKAILEAAFQRVE